MSKVEREIREYVHCCACEGPLKSGKLYQCHLSRQVSYMEVPLLGQRLGHGQVFHERASAILCDGYISESRQPKYAVE
jgi:hypothetical protein